MADQTERDELARTILRSRWPDGSSVEFLTKKTAGMIADELAAAGYRKTTNPQIGSQTEAAHPEDVCQNCGGPNIVWSTASDRFNLAASSFGLDRSAILCPACFVAGHKAATGLSCSWDIIPATTFRPIETERDLLAQIIDAAFTPDERGITLHQGTPEDLATAIPTAGYRRVTDPQIGSQTSATTGKYSFLTLDRWRKYHAHQIEEGAESWCGDASEVSERAFEFAVALANTFGPTSELDQHSGAEVVSWYIEDAMDAVGHVPPGPITIEKRDAVSGDYQFAIFVNGFLFLLEEGEGAITLEPMCAVPCQDGGK